LHPKGAGLSDSQIAEHVGVNHSTVAKYRTELVAACEIRKLTERTGKDGKTYNTTNIGGGSPAGGARGQPITSEALASALARVPEDQRQEVLDDPGRGAGVRWITPGRSERREYQNSQQQSKKGELALARPPGWAFRGLVSCGGKEKLELMTARSLVLNPAGPP